VRKHAAKFALGLLLALFVAALWVGADLLGRVKRRSNTVQTRARELEYYLDSTEVLPGKAPEEFSSGQILSAIQGQWASGVAPGPYSTRILAPPTQR